MHCHAHRLNLVLVDACSTIQCLTDVIGLMQAIHCFIRASTVRHDVFKNIQVEAGLHVMELPQQSDTRWVCKHKAVEVFKLRLDSILKTLEYFAELVGRNGKERAEAKGLLLQLRSLKVCFVLHLLDLLLPVVNCVSKYMQNKDADIATATDLVSSTVVALEAMRTDDTYASIYNDAAALSLSLGISDHIHIDQVVRPTRAHSLPARLHSSVVMATTGSSDTDQLSDPFKREMFDIIETMTNELKSRFVSKKPELLACGTFLPKSQDFMSYEVMAPLAEKYQCLGINCELLKGQVTVAKAMLSRSGASLSHPEDVLQLLMSMQTAFPDLVLFGQLVLTIPVSSANAERSFSALKRVKTYLRSSMAEQRLNSLCLLGIERELSAKVMEDVTPVVDHFAKMKNRRGNLVLAKKSDK